MKHQGSRSGLRRPPMATLTLPFRRIHGNLEHRPESEASQVKQKILRHCETVRRRRYIANWVGLTPPPSFDAVPFLRHMEATEWYRKCACGQSFYKPNSFSNHINSCKRYKTNLGATLEGARARYANKTRPKKGAEAIESWVGADLDVDRVISRPSQSVTSDTTAPPVEPLPEGPHGRGFRLHVPTKRYQDFSLTSAIPFDIPMFGEDIESPRSSPPPRDPLPASSAEAKRLRVLERGRWNTTRQNAFGLYKVYWTAEDRPHDPDLYVSNLDLNDGNDTESSPLPMPLNKYHPFPNWSSYMLGDWYWDDRTGKSRDSFQQLVNIITDPSFNCDEIRDTNWRRVNDLLASSEHDMSTIQEDDRWIEDGTSWKGVDGFRYRPLIPIIIAKLTDPQSCDHFHVVPSELRWHSGRDLQDTRVYSDLYHSDAFLKAYKDIQLLPPEPDQDDLPRCVIGLMFASDETMLTSFGHVKLWPVYMSFGNETKYRRGRVSLKLFEEVAYFQTSGYLPRLVFAGENYSMNSGKFFWIPISSMLMGMALWWIVVMVSEGVFYPRIMTYSADYPERVTVVGIRNLGDYPCPRCLVPMDAIQFIGTHSDLQFRTSQQRVDDDARKKKISAARSSIYKGNYSVNATIVENQLKPTSLVPAQNAFSEQLSTFGFDMHRMLAVDVLHEVEIGIWKSLFIHLLRLLETIDTASIGILNSRFRQMPTFGRDTIRRFSKNVSDRKQFGAREYEDILQCAIPAFEGLFPDDHDSRVQNLLYSLASWHGFAKLRMHTDQSLDILESWTSILGEDARAFTSLTCGSFKTRELKREYETRMRAAARKKSNKAPKRPSRSKAGNVANLPGDATVGVGVPASPSADDGGGRKYRTWNISTPKFHGLGDVVACIRHFGTTDSYSTQMSERFHVHPKARYRRTNRRDVSLQLSRIQMRQARIKKLRSQIYPSPEEKDPTSRLAESAENPPYFIGKSQNKPVNLSHFIRLNANDLATRGFYPKLKQHLFPRVIHALLTEAKMLPERHSKSLEALTRLANSAESDVSDWDANSIQFHSETIYRHSVFQIQYTTYDCRQDCDTLNPSTSRRDFMCIASKDAQADKGSSNIEGTQYVYGRLLGIFHVNVLYMGPGALDYRRRRFDFLWVRWFEAITASEKAKQLNRVKLIPLVKPHSWGFIDPSHVLRAVHLLPRFTVQAPDTDKTPGRSYSRCAREQRDWEEYYVNRFVDRDALMRFHPGLAVGHSPVQHEAAGAPQRSGTPMEVDIPASEEYGAVAMLLDRAEGSTDSEDSNYEGGDNDTACGSSASASEDDSGKADSDQDPDSEEGSDIYP
ncbi:hypothetical protein NMY22_g1480 [Coprinellus aureogranulatus]|nr:hypothetical protein NMY22_g1480 [Coprinellus aureogranulatus]